MNTELARLKPRLWRAGVVYLRDCVPPKTRHVEGRWMNLIYAVSIVSGRK